MAKDVTRTEPAPARRSVDLFDAMRSDLERVFDRFERGWPSFGGFGPGPRSGSSEALAANLDVREEGDKIVVEADLPKWLAGVFLSVASAMLFLSPVVRRIADRFGTRSTIVGACAVMSVGGWLVSRRLVAFRRPRSGPPGLSRRRLGIGGLVDSGQGAVLEGEEISRATAERVSIWCGRSWLAAVDE